MLFSQALLAIASTGALALPYGFPSFSVPQVHFEVLGMRKSTEINPKAVTGTTCIDAKVHIVLHHQNTAELAICGGIEGSVWRCGGDPATTTGQLGSARFTLRAVEEGATINISKRKWEACVRAVRDVCPTGSLRATCVGGATSGDVAFVLDNPWYDEL